VQMGRVLLHFTFEEAQASQEARSLSLRSLFDEGFGADVGDVVVEIGLDGVVVKLERTIGVCHCVGGVVKDMTTE
jgi:hypothetical protein